MPWRAGWPVNKKTMRKRTTLAASACIQIADDTQDALLPVVPNHFHFKLEPFALSGLNLTMKRMSDALFQFLIRPATPTDHLAEQQPFGLDTTSAASVTP